MTATDPDGDAEMTNAHHNVEYTRSGAHSAKNARQTGAPNTQQSGEAPMVGNNPDSRTGSNDPLVTWVFRQVTSQSHRFLSVDDQGRLTVGLDRLAVLVAEIVTDHTADLQARCDLAAGVIEHLEHERHTAQGGGRHA